MTTDPKTIEKTWAQVRQGDQIVGHDGNRWRISERAPSGVLTMIQLQADGTDAVPEAAVTGAPPGGNPVQVFATPEDAPVESVEQAVANVQAVDPGAVEVLPDAELNKLLEETEVKVPEVSQTLPGGDEQPQGSPKCCAYCADAHDHLAKRLDDLASLLRGVGFTLQQKAR